MFDKYDDLATDRRSYFWTGIVLGLAGAVLFYFRAWGLGIVCLGVGGPAFIAAVFFRHSSFEKYLRVMNFISWFAVF
jgi:hypothetical protein